MKKILFIIHRVRLLFSIILFCVVFSSDVIAQVSGCHVTYANSDRLYYMLYPEGGSNAWITTGTIDESGSTGGYREGGSATYGCISDIGGTCTVYQQYQISAGPPQVVGVRIYKTGFYSSISVSNCPIDNYVPFFLFFIAVLGFFKIRKFSTLKIENEANHHHSSF